MTGNDLVAGRFRLGGLLGSGGSASVFVATDTETGSTVALKLLHPHLAAHDDAREALFREARAAGGVRHPNLVAVLDVGTHDSAAGPVAWIALELAPGVSLSEHVEVHGALEPAQALAVTVGVARALEAAHAAGLAHRDISPANIMVDPADGAPLSPDRVRVVDFGLADVASGPHPAAGSDPANDAPPTVVGNANYMSPEQAVGGDVDGRGDLYQLGAVLYFMLTGRPPYPRATTAATMQAHVSAPPPVASVLRSDVPRALDRLVVKAMLKQPDDRFQTVSELLAAVAAITTAQPAADSRTLLLPSAEATNRAIARTARVGPVNTGPSRPSPATPAPSPRVPETPWAWRLGAAFVVLGALVAWIVSSATSAPPPDAAPAPTAVEQPAAAAAAQQKPAAPARVAVPAVVGATLAEARAALEAAGFVVGSVAEGASSLAAGSVSTTAPEAGAELDVGGTVDLVVASGRNVIPSVVGLQRDAAVAAIQGAGFGVLLTVTTDPSVERGSVLASSPEGGGELGIGRPVTLTVATSPAPTATATPTPQPTPTPTVAPDAGPD